MKIIMKYDEFVHPPLLYLSIHGCPHKRQHRAVIKQLRDEIYFVAQRRLGDQVQIPIDHEIDLKLFLTNPASPDLDHLLEAVYMAVDGKSMDGPSLLTDDRLIQSVTISKYYPNEQTKRDGQR